MISCILLTRDPALLAKAIAMFEAQTYPAKELIVAVYADKPVTVPAKYATVACAADELLGVALNKSLAYSRGDLLSIWREGDTYAPGYLARAVLALHGAAVARWTNHLIQFGDEVRRIQGLSVLGSFVLTKAVWKTTPFRASRNDLERSMLSDAKATHSAITEVLDAPTLYTFNAGTLASPLMSAGKTVDAAGLRARSRIWPPRVIHVPFLEHPIGLGDAVKHATAAIGIKPCGGCDQRAATLNAKLTLVPKS